MLLHRHKQTVSLLLQPAANASSWIRGRAFVLYVKVHISNYSISDCGKCAVCNYSMLHSGGLSYMFAINATLHVRSLRVLGDLIWFSNQALNMTCNVFVPKWTLCGGLFPGRSRIHYYPNTSSRTRIQRYLTSHLQDIVQHTACSRQWRDRWVGLFFLVFEHFITH